MTDALEMVERVARLIAAHTTECTEELCSAVRRGDAASCECWQTARAAITAMREPTEAMAAATRYRDMLGGYGYGDDCYEADPVTVWQTMIDAALGEKPEPEPTPHRIWPPE